jgi:hypothetical protein
MPQIHPQSSLAIAGAAATIITTVVVATTITNLKLLISLPPLLEQSHRPFSKLVYYLINYLRARTFRWMISEGTFGINVSEAVAQEPMPRSRPP